MTDTPFDGDEGSVPQRQKADAGSSATRRKPLWTKPAVVGAIITASAGLLGQFYVSHAARPGTNAPGLDDQRGPQPHAPSPKPAPDRTGGPVPGPQPDAAREPRAEPIPEPVRVESPRQQDPQKTKHPTPVDADVEPNDQPASASVLDSSGSLTGRVGWGDDRVDLFALLAPVDGTLTFSVEATCETVKGQRNGLTRPRVLRPDGSERYHTHDSRVPCGKSVSSAPVTVGAGEIALIELKPNTASGTTYSLSWSFSPVR